MRRTLLVIALLAGCTQSGTGVELLIDAGGLTLDQLRIIASYDGHDVTHTVDVASTSALDVIAQLPDRSTTVTFDVTALLSGNIVGHGASDPIAVTAHHLAQTMISLVAGSSADLAMPPIDLAGTGALWSHQQGALPPSAGAIRGLWAASGTDVYAVGTATAGANAFHSTNHGMQWTPQLAGGGGDLNAVGGTSSTDVYLVGDNATILHGSGTSWTAQSSPAAANTRLLAFFAIAPMDLYIAGGGNTIMHSGAGGGWVTQTVVGTTELRGVWGVPGHIWAVGSGGTILKSTGTTWSPETSGTPNELRAVFGTSATDVWVVGDGVVLHSDGGGTWTAAADGVPADVNLRALGGRPGGPVWAVGNAWTIVRRDTSAWVV
ncbi:MAG: WD40/YVTN/BNR-like repeat-containing protein, partial [Polyangia bacterium]